MSWNRHSSRFRVVLPQHNPTPVMPTSYFFHCLLLNSGWLMSRSLSRVSLFTRPYLCSLSSLFFCQPHTLWSYYDRFTLPSLLTSTVDTTYCNIVSNVCHKTNQFILCDIGIQNSLVWGLGSIGGNVDEVEISATSLAQCPAHSHIHSSTNISREVNTGEGRDRGWT